MNESSHASDERFIEDCTLATLAMQLEAPPPVAARASFVSRIVAWFRGIFGGSKP